MMQGRRQITRGPRTQIGAAAIEFAILFLIFFVVLYGTISYGFVFMLQQSLTQAAAEGARAITRVDRLQFAAPAAGQVSPYRAAVETLAKQSAGAALAWLPDDIETRINDGIAVTWSQNVKSLPTGATTGPASVRFVTVRTDVITVTVSYDYAAAPILPVLVLPGFSIPNIPGALVGQATLTP